MILSPRGDRAALSIGNGLSILDLSRLSLTKLTLSRRAENPAWSRDRRRIYFGYEQGKSYQIHSKAVDDSGVPELVVPSDRQEDPYSLSPYGSRPLAIRFTADGQRALLVHQLGATRSGPHSALRQPSGDRLRRGARRPPPARRRGPQPGGAGAARRRRPLVQRGAAQAGGGGHAVSLRAPVAAA
jgi:hypothetical protein